MTTESLVLSCVGRDRPGLVGELTRAIAEHGGNILDSRMAILGGEFAVIMLLETAAGQRESLEAALRAHAGSAGLSLDVHPTADDPAPAPGRSYRLRADTMDHPGIVQQVAAFLGELGINIAELETSVWAAPHTGTPMFTLDMQVIVPAAMSAQALREAFTAFCVETDLDATLEPFGP